MAGWILSGGITHQAAKAAGGTGAVTTAALSGLETAGTLGGLVFGVGSLVIMWITITANNRQKRREYEQEIQDAFNRGQAAMSDALGQARRDRDFFREKYFETLGVLSPIPPSQGGGNDASPTPH